MNAATMPSAANVAVEAPREVKFSGRTSAFKALPSTPPSRMHSHANPDPR